MSKFKLESWRDKEDRGTWLLKRLTITEWRVYSSVKGDKSPDTEVIRMIRMFNELKVELKEDI
jgi:hypothetical protein